MNLMGLFLCLTFVNSFAALQSVLLGHVKHTSFQIKEYKITKLHTLSEINTFNINALLFWDDRSKT